MAATIVSTGVTPWLVWPSGNCAGSRAPPASSVGPPEAQGRPGAAPRSPSHEAAVGRLGEPGLAAGLHEAMAVRVALCQSLLVLGCFSVAVQDRSPPHSTWNAGRPWSSLGLPRSGVSCTPLLVIAFIVRVKMGNP